MRNTHLTLLAITLVCGCGNEGTIGSRCAPNTTQQCACSTGQQGYQVCAPDGADWGACQCTGSGVPTDPGQPQSPTDPGQPQSPTDPEQPQSPTSPPAGQTGTMTCAQVDSCMMSCSDTDDACFDTCFYQGTANAQTQMSALESCMSNAEQGACQSQCVNYDQQCETCLTQACQSELNACLGSSGGNSGGTGQTGTMTCAQVDSCMMSCSDTDDACFDTCFYQGTSNAQTLMSALETCMWNAEEGACQSQCVNYDQQCETCLTQACQSELNTCLNN